MSINLYWDCPCGEVNQWDGASAEVTCKCGQTHKLYLPILERDIHVLSIEHRQGTISTWLFSDGDQSIAALHDYVRFWWDDNGPGYPMPKDMDKAAELYFEYSGESYVADTAKLDQFPYGPRKRVRAVNRAHRNVFTWRGR